jgi:hypothetical protein
MFLRSSSRPQPVDCFFCLSPSLLPPLNTTVDRKGKGRLGEVGTKWNWNCERCGCWNIRDEVSHLAHSSIFIADIRMLGNDETSVRIMLTLIERGDGIGSGCYEDTSYEPKVFRTSRYFHHSHFLSSSRGRWLTKSEAILITSPIEYGCIPILSYLPNEPNIDNEHVGQLPPGRECRYLSVYNRRS